MCKRNHQIVRMLKSLSVNYEIIKDIGYALEEPIMIVFDRKNRTRILENTTNFTAKSLDEFAKKKDVESALCETSSEFVLMPYPTTRKGRELLDYIVTVMKTGISSSGHINAPPLILAEGKVCRKDMEDLFTIYIEGDLSEMSDISLAEVVPSDEQVEVVLDKARELNMQGRTQMEKTLLVASCFLYPYLEKYNRVDELEELFYCVEELVKQNEEGSYVADLGELFIAEIYEWQERTGFHNVFELPDIEMNIIDHIEEVFLFDSKYFYMKESLFTRIAGFLLNTFPAEVLKSALVDDEILCPESEKTYTIKVNYRNAVSGYERIRMLRFKRSAFKRWGDLELIDICIDEKEDAGDEN